MGEDLEQVLAKVAEQKKARLSKRIEAAQRAGLTPEQSTRLEDGTEAELAAQAEVIAREEPEPELTAEQLALASEAERKRKATEAIFPIRRREP
jgi:hypothetical protein